MVLGSQGMETKTIAMVPAEYMFPSLDGERAAELVARLDTLLEAAIPRAETCLGILAAGGGELYLGALRAHLLYPALRLAKLAWYAAGGDDLGGVKTALEGVASLAALGRLREDAPRVLGGCLAVIRAAGQK